jgi:protein-S-isoprenylcysteine O-methyltransferase Ste14
MPTHYLPVISLLFFILVCVVWRGWLQYRRYGQLGIVLFQSAAPGKLLRDAFFATLFVAVFVQAILVACAREPLPGLASVQLPTSVTWLGAALMALGTALTVAAQLHMGESWRIGIDEKAAPGLVTTGLYGFCRNPIYLGMIANLIGITVMLPTWLSVALAIGVVWCIRQQTLDEEVYLRRTYGAAFLRYASHVGRFVPGLGRLRPRRYVEAVADTTWF